MRRLLYCLVACTLLVMPEGTRAIITSAAHADSPPPSEYMVKAAYLYNFVKFVEWPGSQGVRHINLCVVGEDPFGSTLSDLEKASTDTLKISVRRNVDGEALKRCQMLFIGVSEESRLDEILAQVQNLPVLTVSEIHNFVHRGGVIGFINVEKNIGVFTKDQVKLEINVKSASRANLRIDANLLEVAANVVGK